MVHNAARNAVGSICTYNVLMILVVDDEIEIAEVVVDIIDQAFPNKICIKVNDPRSAIDIIQNNNIELLITDLKMPNYDGTQLIEALREVTNVPVVVMSGFIDEFKDRLKKFDGVLAFEKPFNHDEFIEKVDSFMAQATELDIDF